MGIALVGVLGVVTIVNLVCFIIVLIKPFAEEGAGKGILGLICGIYTFCWGWQNADRLNIRTVMTIWTIGFVISTTRGQNLRQEPLGGMGKPEDRPAPGNRKACPCEVSLISNFAVRAMA